MSKFISEKIHVVNSWTSTKNDNFKCSPGIKLMYNHFIYDVEKTINGKKKIFNFSVDRYACGTNILKEEYKIIK